MHKMGGKWDGICCTLFFSIHFRFDLETSGLIWEKIIRMALAGSLSLWIFVVVPKDGFADEIAWRGGKHERLGGHYVLRREGKILHLACAEVTTYFMRAGLQLGHGLGFTCLV